MFTTRNYPSLEKYDLAKFMNFVTDCYDVIDSPLLNKLKNLPIFSYYDVSNGYKDIDMISQDVYGNPYLCYYILYYNDLIDEVIPENTILKIFSLTDLDNLVHDISLGII
jgi:hypothetical protein